MGNSSFSPINKARTLQGADTGESPNQARATPSKPGSYSSPAPAPKAKAPTLTAGGYPTMQGAVVPTSPNDTNTGYPKQKLQQPDGYTGGGGKGEAQMPGKRESAAGYGTTDGATIPPSPNDADDLPSWADGSGSNPNNGQGALPNGATDPMFDTAGLARRGMSAGNEMPVMARGTPPMARIASGDLRRNMAPVAAETARPSGASGPQGLASFARSGGYVPLHPIGVNGSKQAPMPAPSAGSAPGAMPKPSIKKPSMGTSD